MCARTACRLLCCQGTGCDGLASRSGAATVTDSALYAAPLQINNGVDENQRQSHNDAAAPELTVIASSIRFRSR